MAKAINNATINNTNAKENTTMTLSQKTANIINAHGIKAEITTVRKGDDIKEGITLGEGVVRPTTYVDESLSAKENAKRILEQYENIPIPDFNADMFSDLDNVKENIVVCLRRPTSDECTDLKMPYLDMEMYIKFIVDGSADGQMSITIKEDHLSLWDISKDELFDIAIDNARANLTIRGMGEVMMEMMGMSSDEMGMPVDTENEKIFVASNKSKLLGACAFVFLDKIKEFADLCEDDLYMIPSSVHEILLVKATGSIKSDLDAMVQEVNATQVEPNEQLSDHAYFFCRELGEINY